MKNIFLIFVLLIIFNYHGMAQCQLVEKCQPQGFNPSYYQQWTYSDDFESNEVNGWDSYPPWEDTAFDFTLLCTESDLPNSMRALTREVKPNYDNQLLPGLIKKFHFFIDENSYIRFAAYLDCYQMCDDFQVVLCGGDGERYVRRFKSPQPKTWQTIEFPLNQCISKKGRAFKGLEIQALYILPIFEKADMNLVYRFKIDNFVICGLKPKRFRIVEPVTISHEQWEKLYTLRHYTYGESFNLKIQIPEIPLLPGDIQFDLIEPFGNIRMKNVSLSQSGKEKDIFELKNAITFSKEYPQGQWKVIVHGSSSKFQSLTTDFSFFLLDKTEVRQHPRVLFTQQEKSNLQKRITDPKAGKIWKEIENRARKLRESIDLMKIGTDEVGKFDDTYWLPTYGSYVDLIRTSAEMVELNALVYALTGDTEALEAARKNLVRMCQWKQWCHPWVLKHGQFTYWPVGLAAASLGIAYDLIFDQLTEDERKSVRTALMEKHIIPTFKEYYRANRVPFHASNWIPHTTGSALVDIAAIYGDDPELESLEPYLTGILMKFKAHLQWSFDRDGAYGEGWGYHYFDLFSLSHAVPCLKRVFNVDLLQDTNVKNSYLYPLYAFKPPHELIDYGDTHNEISGLSNFAWLVKSTRDPLLNWFYHRTNNNESADFIYYDDSIPQTSPGNIPNSRFFRDRGVLVSRTGWEPNSTVFIEKSGPFYNHNHIDQGSFFLSVNGETLIDEAGWAGYYDDPWYWSYFIQPRGHNTVLVDDDPESQQIGDLPGGVSALKNYCTTESFLCSEFYDMARQELSPVYRSKLSNFSRGVIFYKPYYIVFFDNIHSADQPVQLSWLIHTPDKSRVNVYPDYTGIQGRNASVLLKTLFPLNADIDIQSGKVRITDVKDVKRDGLTIPGIIEIKTPEKQSKSKYLNVLFPVNQSVPNPDFAKSIQRIESENTIGFRIFRDKTADIVLFQPELNSGSISAEGISASANHVAVSIHEQSMVLWAMESGTSLKREDQLLCSASSPINAAAKYDSDKIIISAALEKDNSIELYTGKAPRIIKVDGSSITNIPFTYNPLNKTAAFGLQKGRYTIKVEF